MNSADAGEAVRAASARAEARLKLKGKSIRIDSTSPWDVRANSFPDRPRFAPSSAGKRSKPIAFELSSAPLKGVKAAKRAKALEEASGSKAPSLPVGAAKKLAKKNKARLRRELLKGTLSNWTPAHVERLAGSNRTDLRELRAQFSEALRVEFARENLEFLMAVSDFKRITDPRKREEAAQQIIATYIDEKAEKAVNISSEARRAIANGKGIGKGTSTAPAAFDRACQAIAQDLAQSQFRRFMAGPK